MYTFYNVTEYRRLRNSCGGLPGPGWALRLGPGAPHKIFANAYYGIETEENRLWLTPKKY